MALLGLKYFLLFFFLGQKQLKNLEDRGSGLRLGQFSRDNFARGKILPPLNSSKLEMPYAQMTTIQHTYHAQERDTK